MNKKILEKPLICLKGINKKKSLLLQKLNLYTYKDFVSFYPKKYIYFHTKKISDLNKNLLNKDNFFIQIFGKIIDIKKIKKKNKSEKILKAILSDSTGYIELIWFNNFNFLYKKIKKNLNIFVRGKLIFFQKKMQIIHPNIQYLSFHEKISFFKSIYPIPKKLDKKGINNNFISKYIKKIIKEINENPKGFEDFLFKDILKKNLFSKKDILIKIHFPRSINEINIARYFLKLEEFFFIKLFLLSKKNTRLYNNKQFKKIGEFFYFFYKNCIPFNLTNSQKKVLKEIWNDLKKPIQMKRLLQGEVGSGKTIIALSIMLLAYDNGFQSCLMAPTEILAIQHFFYIKKILSKLKVNINLLTSSTPKKEREYIYKCISIGKIFILIGTHSLIQNKIKFKNLGIAIIDEQQRFGIEQRKKLYKNNNFPHMLLMTATPIPRTLEKIIYHDIDISILRNERLKNKYVKTIHLWNEKKEKAFEIIKNQIFKGKQIYIIYPIINSSLKKKKCKSLKEGYQEITKKFKSLKKFIGILHGKMNSIEKKKQIKKFLEGKIKIIISTTVIEVGIDIPNASVILVENANFFGLSQLHQLRGRVGRGCYPSYCILITNKEINLNSYKKIKEICKTNKGLNLSKKDLEIRGGGDLIYDTKQSGKKNINVLDFPIIDYKLMRRAIILANIFFEKNPEYLKLNNFYFLKKGKFIP